MKIGKITEIDEKGNPNLVCSNKQIKLNLWKNTVTKDITTLNIPGGRN